MKVFPWSENAVNPMRELVTTRHNELVDPLLKVWGVEIAIYLFLGGMVAGMMIILGYFLFKGRHKELSCSCALLPGLCIVLLSLGMLALFLDLEHRWYFWRMYLTFKPASPMSWGAWILLLVYPALLAAVVLAPAGTFERLYSRPLRAPSKNRWKMRLWLNSSGSRIWSWAPCWVFIPAFF